MKRRLVRIVGVAAAVVLTVVACGDSPAGSAPEPHCTVEQPCTGDPRVVVVDGDGWFVKHVTVDGRMVTCVVLLGAGHDAIAMSCDWSPR